MIKKLTLFLLIVLFAISVSACNNTIGADHILTIPAEEPTIESPITTEGDETTFEAKELLGSWAWDIGFGLDEDSFIYTFNADGTGQRGAFGKYVTFGWVVDGENLDLDFDGIVEEWIFFIEDDTLTVDSRQLDGVVLEYVRVDG